MPRFPCPTGAVIALPKAVTCMLIEPSLMTSLVMPTSVAPFFRRPPARPEVRSNELITAKGGDISKFAELTVVVADERERARVADKCRAGRRIVVVQIIHSEPRPQAAPHLAAHQVMSRMFRSY